MKSTGGPNALEKRFVDLIVQEADVIDSRKVKRLKEELAFSREKNVQYQKRVFEWKEACDELGDNW